MSFVNYRDSRPIFRQISDHFKEEILKGTLKVDEQLPSVRSLAVELATNPNTVQKAYTQLERDGFCYSVRGRGSFVCDNSLLLSERRSQLKERMMQILKEAEALGIPPSDLITEVKGELHD